METTFDGCKQTILQSKETTVIVLSMVSIPFLFSGSFLTRRSGIVIIIFFDAKCKFKELCRIFWIAIYFGGRRIIFW